MSEKKVTVRLVMEGGKVVEAELVTIGKKGGEALKQIDTGAERVSKSTGAMRANVQNAAFQVQDFFVQVAGGTSATRALSQQLPQLLGSLGLIGVLAGTAAAALIPMFGVLFDGRNDVEELAKDINTLEAAISALKAADIAASQPVTDMIAQYGMYAEQAKQVLAIKRQMAELDATSAFATAAGTIPGAMDATGVFGGMSSTDLEQKRVAIAAARVEYEQLTQQIQVMEAQDNAANDQAIEDMYNRQIAAQQAIYDLSEYSRGVNDLAMSFGISEDAAGRLAVAAARVGEADTTEQRLSAAQALTDAIWQETDGLKTSSDASRDLYEKLVDAYKAGLDLAVLDIASGIDAGADAAARLAANLRVAATASAGLDDSQLIPTVSAGANASASGTMHFKPKRGGGGHSGGGGGGGGMSDAQKRQNDQMREAQRVYDQTRTAVEKYDIEQAKLDELLKSGLVTTDTYTRAMDQLAEKYMDTGDAAKFWKDANADLKNSILDLAVDGVNSFDQIAKAIKRAAMEALLFGTGPMASMFGGKGGGGGIFGGLFGGLFKGLFSFEGGGDTGHGARSGGLDGRGGFLSVLHPQETVIDRTKPGAGTAAGMLKVELSVINGNLVPLVTQIAGNVAVQVMDAGLQRQTPQMAAIVSDQQLRGTK